MTVSQIPNLYKTTSFSEIYSIVENCEAEISFWGYRVVRVGSDSVTIDALADLVMKLVEKNPHFEERERPDCKKLSKKISLLYSQTKNKIQNYNFLTRFFFSIVEFWARNIEGYGYGIRYRWPSRKKFYRLYTREQFVKTFGYQPDKHFKMIRYGKFPDRWDPFPRPYDGGRHLNAWEIKASLESEMEEQNESTAEKIKMALLNGALSVLKYYTGYPSPEFVENFFFSSKSMKMT